MRHFGQNATFWKGVTIIRGLLHFHVNLVEGEVGNSLQLGWAVVVEGGGSVECRHIHMLLYKYDLSTNACKVQLQRSSPRRGPSHCFHSLSHQSTVYNSIIQIAESKEVEYLQMLRATGQRLVFCADAAWSHRGYEANQCCWLLLNAENKQIALAVILTKSRWEKGEEVHKGSYKGSSGGMEGMAMERGIARLKENGLLPLVQGWVCDKDSSVSEQLKANPDTAHIPIHYDPGHIKKNFQKSLMTIYRKGVRYKGLAERGG